MNDIPDQFGNASGSFGPSTVKAMCHAFAEAWDEVSGQFASPGLLAHSAREVLADAILQAARHNPHHDVAALKNAGLSALAEACKDW